MSIENNLEYPKYLNEATQSLEHKLQFKDLTDKPKIAVVLGSGLGAFVEDLDQTRAVAYETVAHMPKPSVPGHGGQWIYGKSKSGTPLLVAQGRFHMYEGHHQNIITLPIRMMKKLGIEHVILTNAAGSVNLDYRPGDFMLIEDHINCSGRTPLTGTYPAEIGERFVDLSHAYHAETNLKTLHGVTSKNSSIRLHLGIYCMMHGPQYETPAEIRMLGKLGGDAVGMSTVPETLVCNQLGLKVNGISCITNLGAGLSKNKLNHEEVAEMGRNSAKNFTIILNEMVKSIVMPA